MPSRRDLLKLALLAPVLSACGGGSHAGGSEQPIATKIAPDDWSMATPDSQGIGAALLESLLTQGAKLPFLYSLLVVRNGLMIGERYYNGAQSGDLRSLASCTKTVSSLLTGQALGEGKLATASATLATLLPKQLAKLPADTYAAGISLQQLLDMTGGQAWDEAVRQLDATNAPDMTAFALALPSDGKPRGKVWTYTTASSHLVSPILQEAYGMDELALAQRQLFAPLGIQAAAWSRDASGMVHGSFGLQLRTRDLAKLGQMALDGGRWQGRQVVPAAWITDSTAVPHIKHLGEDGDLLDVGYGNLWWHGILGGRRVAYMDGYGGQFAVLVPDLNLLLATNGELNVSYGQAAAQEGQILAMLARFLRSLA